ncbi:MAG TPA: rhodanese-like domain-containing protein, partial [Ktedonobacterales bacterium]|nr:rhodanese-like domain-containing protein [Ktedonobacterales bacterium]
WKQPDAPMVVDVRRADEWREGHIPGALHLHIGELPQRLAAVPSGGTVALICASGYRAQIAASLLAAQGRTVLAVDGGVPVWQRAGLPIAVDDPPAAVPAPDEHGHP